LLLTVQCSEDHRQVKDTKSNKKRLNKAEFCGMITLIVQFFLEADVSDTCTVGSRSIGSLALLNSTFCKMCNHTLELWFVPQWLMTVLTTAGPHMLTARSNGRWVDWMSGNSTNDITWCSDTQI